MAKKAALKKKAPGKKGAAIPNKKADAKRGNKDGKKAGKKATKEVSVKEKSKPVAKKPAVKKVVVKEISKKSAVPPKNAHAVTKAPGKQAAAGGEKAAEKAAKAREERIAAAREKAANLNTQKAKIEVKLTGFLKRQQQRLLELRDALVDSMAGVAQDNLRSRAEGSEASAFGMHQADAGSDAYDRDFALNLLSQEQDALYEIEEALKRVDEGTYGVCEMSGRKISKARLEAIPFARLTVECQAQVEKEQKNGYRRHSVRSLFGLNDDEDDGDSDVTTADALEKDEK